MKLLLDHPDLILENKTFLLFLIVKRLGGASLFVLSVVTSIIFWRSWRLTAPLWAIALYSWAIILPVHYEPRYAVGGTMAYLILASIGLAMSWQWVHGKLRRQAIDTE